MKLRPELFLAWYFGLPPHGGSGLKSAALKKAKAGVPSPSTRREWIEIQLLALYQQLEDGLPPHGGSGLKSIRWIARTTDRSLPPHGGSGLK